MKSADLTPQTQSRMAFIVVILGLAAVTAVILWDHPPLPSDSPETARVREFPAVSSAGLDTMFAALGIHRPAKPSAAPEFTLRSLEGRPAQLREFRGKLVLLNF